MRSERSKVMSVMDGCEKLKVTPMLREIKCPECGEEMEVFTRDEKAVEDFTCPVCGYVIKAGDRI